MKFKFKNYEDYQNQRQDLLSQAEEALNNGETEQFNSLTADVTTMDQDWDEYRTNMANLQALQKNQKPMANIIGGSSTTVNPAATDLYDTVEYRRGFMNYVMTGNTDSRLFNEDQVSKTTENGVMIPTTVLNRIIEKMESTGMILAEITRTAYKGGLTIPTSSAKPVATWVAEGAGSDEQKKTTGSLTFAYHKLRCAVAVTLEMDTMALSAFETMLVNNVSEAMVKALEQAIISGSGTGQPKGVLKETVPDKQNIDLAAEDDPDYALLVEAEAALPQAYEANAKWYMTKTTFMKFVGMTDQNGQPIARVNYGINGKPERFLLGRPVICNDYMTSLGATITEDTVVAFIFNMKDYVLNTNLNMTVKTYEDNNTDDKVTKAIMLADGKVVDKNSLFTVTKKKASL